MKKFLKTFAIDALMVAALVGSIVGVAAVWAVALNAPIPQ